MDRGDSGNEEMTAGCIDDSSKNLCCERKRGSEAVSSREIRSWGREILENHAEKGAIDSAAVEEHNCRSKALSKVT